MSLKLAVIGTGHLGRIHARLIAGMDGAELFAVADPVEEPRQAVAAEHGCRAVADYHDLIGQIHGAVVATPTSLHHEVAHTLLSAGIHTLIEKPITSTVAEADDLLELAAENERVVQVGHVERFNPGFTSARSSIDRPKYIEAVRAGGYTFRSTDVSVVLDLMIHDIDLVLSLVQSPLAEVDALGVCVFGPHEDIVQARLTFESGCIANLTASRTSFRPQRSMDVYSAAGFAGIDFGGRTAQVVSVGEQLQRGVDVHALSVEEKDHMREHLFTELLPLKEIQPPQSNAISDELHDFCRAIRTGCTPLVSGRAGRDALQVAQAVVESVHQHRWNGHHAGPVGPHLLPVQPDILRGPHFDQAAKPEVRKAG